MSVRVEMRGEVPLLLLDRPAKAHAYDAPMLDALAEAVAGLSAPVAVVASTGEGAFCGGADLDALAAARPEDALDHRAQHVFDALARAPAVTVCAVQGPAVGGGFELALACDLRVAGPRARFRLPETALGLVPSAGGCARLVRMVGVARARELVLVGRELDAREAEAWGLVGRVADPPLPAALELARDLATRDPLALRLARRVLDGAAGCIAPALERERLAQAILYGRRGGRG